jgi:hypothetical protein
MESRVYLHIVSTSSPHALHLDSKAPVCAGELVRLWGEGEMVPTGASAHAAGRQSDRGQRQPRESHTGEPGTGFVLPPPVRLAGPAGLRPGGRRCWMCGQAGRADPPATAYFYCAGCDVRWYGGTSRLRHSPEFTQGDSPGGSRASWRASATSTTLPSTPRLQPEERRRTAPCRLCGEWMTRRGYRADAGRNGAISSCSPDVSTTVGAQRWPDVTVRQAQSWRASARVGGCAAGFRGLEPRVS